MDRGFEDLRLVDGEVFADGGDGDALAGGVEILQAPRNRSGSVRTERQAAPWRS